MAEKEFVIEYQDYKGEKQQIRYTKYDIPKTVAQKALDSQSACNLNIVKTMAAAIPELRSLERSNTNANSTAWLSHHPVMIMYLTQIMHLTGMGILPTKYDVRGKEYYSACYDLCEEAAER